MEGWHGAVPAGEECMQRPQGSRGYRAYEDLGKDQSGQLQVANRRVAQDEMGEGRE